MPNKSLKLARNRCYLKDKYTAGKRGKKKQLWLPLHGFIRGSDHLKSYCDAAQPLVLSMTLDESRTALQHFTLPSNSTVPQSLPFSSVMPLIVSKQNLNRTAVIPKLNFK